VGVEVRRRKKEGDITYISNTLIHVSRVGVEVRRRKSVCVCVCVCDGERERGREGERERGGERQRERGTESVCGLFLCAVCTVCVINHYPLKSLFAVNLFVRSG
jgi:hypothetical protein